MFKTSATILKGLVALFIGVGPVRADPPAPPCVEDAMIVFDASGSMGGNLDQGIATLKPRIDEVRSALAEVLPSVTRIRRVGLITYGPGPGLQCNVKLDLKPTANAAARILRILDGVIARGQNAAHIRRRPGCRRARLSQKPGRHRRSDRWRRNLRCVALRPRQRTSCERSTIDRPRRRLSLEGLLVDRRAKHLGREVPRRAE